MKTYYYKICIMSKRKNIQHSITIENLVADIYADYYPQYFQQGSVVTETCRPVEALKDIFPDRPEVHKVHGSLTITHEGSSITTKFVPLLHNHTNYDMDLWLALLETRGDMYVVLIQPDIIIEKLKEHHLDIPQNVYDDIYNHGKRFHMLTDDPLGEFTDKYDAGDYSIKYLYQEEYVYHLLGVPYPEMCATDTQ
jgi:hypothetical protein